jgi:hypothetical protein
VLGFGLEGLGLLVWVRLVDAIIASDNKEITNSLTFLWATAIAYEALLIGINVVLTWQDGGGIYTLTLLLICLLPALSAAMYGLHRKETAAQLERERIEAKVDAERIRQERRQDRKDAAQLRTGLVFNADTDRVELMEEARNNGSKFRQRKK